jgi:hypothetical protein
VGHQTSLGVYEHQIDWSAKPAASAPAASPLRAAFEGSRLSREEISTAARIAAATVKPAPPRYAWSKPLVSS